MDLFSGLNWLATTASVIVSFMLGAIWYSKYLFGEKWAAGVGIPFGPEEKQPVVALVLQLTGTAVLAVTVAITFAIDQPVLALLVGGCVSILMMAGGGFSHSSTYAIFAEGGFVIMMLLIMMGFQAAFS